VNHYPIVPGDINGTPMSSFTPPSTGAAALTYGGSTPDIEGFWVSQPGSSGALSVAATQSNPVPMPVQWLYVLRDGTVQAPSSSPPASGQGNSVLIPQATATNPIVGRIAFWTDDECSKININTASEGVFWDTPRVTTAADLAHLAVAQPAQHEYQRYPGHPAMTCLSTVFGKWLPGTTPVSGSSLTTANYANYFSPYYSLVPRIVDGMGVGSEGGTATPTAVLAPDADRLYDSIDELLFAPTMSGVNRALNNAALTESQLEEAKFFITAHSRAPDLNLFNQPRVSVWPISTVNDANHRSASDQLIAFCTTLGKGTSGHPFYFQRNTVDAGQPGYASPTADIGISRNQQLLAYLRNFCGQKYPGFDNGTYGSLAGKFNTYSGASGTPSEMNQIMTEIFDYIRCTNIYDNASLSANSSFKTFTPYINNGSGYIGGEIVPSFDAATQTKGFGRFLTVSKAALVFVAVANQNTKITGAGTSAGITVPAAKNIRVQAMILLDTFSPSLSNPGLYPTNQAVFGSSGYSISVTGPEKWAWGGTSMGFPSNGGTLLIAPFGASDTRNWGGNYGLSNMFSYIGYGSSAPAHAYPMVSALKDFPISGSIAFGGGNLQLAIKYGGTTVQTLNLSFPQGNFPVPGDAAGNVAPVRYWNGRYINYANITGIPTGTSSGSSFYADPLGNGYGVTVGSTSANPESRNFFYYGLAPASPALPDVAASFKINAYDVAESVQSNSGDIRLIAGRQNIASGDAIFQPHPLYGSRFAHSMVEAMGMPYYGATRGELAPLGPVGSQSHYYAIGGSYGASTSPVGYPPLGTTPFPYNGTTTDLPATPTAAAAGASKAECSWILTSEPEVTSISGVKAGSTTIFGMGSNCIDFNPGSTDVPGDWDNGMADAKDGAYINETDEGSTPSLLGGSHANAAVWVPYFDWAGTSAAINSSIYSPNREVPSAAMFGSLSTGVIGEKSWQTLLFRPDPDPLSTGSSTLNSRHIGADKPMDHLLLDLFTMPVVEPYAISEPLSTAGRINMNYQILPFTYINRDTGVRAVMKAEKILAIPNSAAGNSSTSGSTGTLSVYKNMDFTQVGGSNWDSPATQDYRLPINLDETMKGFQARFATNDIFRSPSEICTLDLIPQDSGATYGNMETKGGYWSQHALTGDNSRERPYADIYPRLTTKSNTFTIYMRVQTLQKLKTDADPRTWTENVDVVTGEYRGSETVERYVDPNDGRLTDGAINFDYADPTYTTGGATPPLISQLYKFRVVSSKQFSP
jgi:uncharacterized protein (TIGR02600 family)